ncbi:mRNA surveillance protein pelota [Methanobrevibacter sp. TMH8]|uniref:mRNA surveillance protein pelota n=1 Tax=Methanobrevibacter sp. TMH8 TaxID=2848611 RepID=UPI001CCF9FA4|nr:mRNA surveillance protein pelota [Methanobrevibacter sp. TMH8]MBZ9570748.1 mRNA surveillance protein pelota [Methanobrevibacter sp. TMH8]
MKITFQDTKQGIMEIVPETLDDLWHISHIIEEGDVLSSKTTRRIQDTTGDKLRSDRGVKKTFFLGIKVDSVSFHMFTGKLRATGSIVSGPEDIVPLGSHHTLEVKLNIPLRIKKERWSRYVLNRIKQAVAASKKLSAIIVSIEDDVADLGLVRQFGIEYYGPIIGNISGKRIIDKNRQKNVDEFYQKVAEALLKFDDLQNIVIAGPGFTKNSFHDYLEDKHKNLAKISILESTGAGGRVGIQEILKKGVVEKLSSENRIAKEISTINNVLGEIAKGSNMVVYGKEETIAGANAGAIEKLLILDKLVRIRNIEKVMNLVENMGGKLMVISSEHDGGKQLESLGGLAAILRYPIK